MPNSHYDFFIAQARHKANSLLFYRLFALVVFCHALAVAVVGLLIGFLVTDDWGLSQFLLALALLFVYMALGIFVQKYRLAKGGIAIAKKLGAVRLFISPSQQAGVAFFPNFIRANQIRDLPSGYARFYEFAEQMSLASGLPVPLLYVLPNEQGINGFVAGFDEQDTVLILTQGAIDALDNEGLYGLIAHQYSAIMHGDGKLNIKVAIMTTGLSWFYECGEWLERLLLGEFNANYHKQTINQPLSQQDWVSYWQQEYQKATTNTYDKKYNSQAQRDTDAFVFALPLFGFLVLIRLLGLLGMASSDWIVSKFNRERSFLADATSIQLTRSYGIAGLLKYLNTGSSYLNNRTVNHLGYFFFAPIRPQEEFFDTHPTVDERLDKLGDKAYFVQSSELVQPLDKQELKQSHDWAVAHAPIVALAQEILVETITYQEAPQDSVVNGRLVVNQAWFDWRPHQDDELDSAKNNKQTDISTQSIDANLPEIFSLADIKKINPDWVISKHQRTVLGTIIVIESLQLMRFKFLPCEYQFDLVEIYEKNVSDDQFNTKNNAIKFDKIYPHFVGDDLLNALAKLDRKVDGCLTYLAFKKLNQQLHNDNIPLTDKELTILTHYYHQLLLLLKVGQSQLDPIKNYHRLVAKIYKLYQGTILALLLKRLGGRLERTVDEDLCVQILGNCQKFVPSLMDFPQKVQIQLILLAFLLSVQDNTLLLGQTNKLTQAFARLGQLASLPCCLKPNDIIALMHTTHGLLVGEWAILLLDLVGVENANNFVETLHTTCLYNANLSQKEQDLLLILKELIV